MISTFIESISWPYTVPLAAIIIVYILRDSLAEIIKRIKRVKGEGKNYDILFDSYPNIALNTPTERPQQALSDPGQTVITKQDVIDAFKTIPDFTEQDVRQYLDAIHQSLLRYGVITKTQLFQLVSSVPVLDTVRRLYVDVLHRDPKKTLDPMAVAVWGSTLFSHGLKKDLIDEIELRLRQSPEYKKKHSLT